VWKCVSIQDLAAGFVSGLAVGGIIVLAALHIDPPPSLPMVLGSAMTWLFIRSTHTPTPETTPPPGPPQGITAGR